ncbi:MAG TPA: CUAEP/CCAEP-tail radical SAM protein, partial [Ktedonobacterales bacterium]|nr:CUAEP/CCAEP-tail radical SAM protein [Ktedonobacterales bacterium]
MSTFPTPLRTSLAAPGAILLVACYELGHQPLSLASPQATLAQAGYAPVAVDTSVTELDDEAIRAVRFVAIAVPMHTALRLGLRVAERVRALAPNTPICFYGLYAALNADYLLREHANAIIGGEYEEALLALVRALDAIVDLTPWPPSPRGKGDELSLPVVAGVRTRTQMAGPILARLPFAVPSRETLEPPARYAHLVRADGSVVVAGYVEASRGCLHTCLHCPITPVYGGRFFAVQREVVLADIRAQVQQGVEHITFGDPDFMNGPKHSLALVRALHEEFPQVTFDATIKVEHLIERRALMPELAELGCAFIVS